MFGSLKKALKGAIAKVTGKIGPGEPVREEEAKKPKPVKVESAHERLEHEIEERIEELKEVKEEVRKEAEPEELREEKEAFEEVREQAIEKPELETEKQERKEIAEETKVKQPEEIIEEAEQEAAELEKEELRIDEAPRISLEKIKPEEPEMKEKRGFLKRIVEKTLSESEIEDILKELEMALLENDVAVEVAERIGADIKTALAGASVRRGKVDDVIRSALRNAVLDILNQERIDLDKRISGKDGPYLVMFVGFNGTGKTTSVARVANRFRQFKPVLAAADTFRAASIEQLEEHGRRLGVEVIKHRYGADSAAVVFDAVKHARAVSSKLVLADTAGRSHANANLMDELSKVVRVNKPDLKILVLDALAGNDIYDQAKLFDKAVGVDAIILTKVDVYDKGGAALSAAYTLKKPILFLGTGQGYDDLQPFNPEKIVKNLLD